MIIKPIVTFIDGYFTQQFAMGDSREHENYTDKKYPYYVISYLIDTGNQVILIDTSFPDEIGMLPANDDLGVFTGRRVKKFESALNDAGYKVGSVDKVIITHNHLDHAGMLSLFDDEKIYMSEGEYNTSKNKIKANSINMEKGEFQNFKGVYELCKNIYMIKAYGHSKGQILVLAYNEAENFYYMFSGDVSFTLDSLKQNKHSIVTEDINLAKITQKNILEFIKNNKTIYLSSHDPKSLESLKNKRFIKL